MGKNWMINERTHIVSYFKKSLLKIKNPVLLKLGLSLPAFIHHLSVRVSRSEKGNTIELRNGARILKISDKHLAYAGDIINNFDFYFNAVEPTLKSGFMVVDYSKPFQHVLKESKTPFYFVSLPEPLETINYYIEKSNLKKGDVVFDLGAYCGVSTWAFANRVGNEGCVYAFEPDPENYEAILKNIALHDLKNVELVKKGVWSSSTQLYFQS